MLAFFASDDWLLLYRYGRPPFPSLDVHFSPEVIWFYRPLQSLQFNLQYHLFGLNPLPWNLVSTMLHLMVLWLTWRFLLDLTRHRILSALAAALFALHWAYVDVVFWKCNLNTLHSALLTMACALQWLRHLRTGSNSAICAVYILSAVNLLSRESAVNTPLILGLIWWHERRPELRTLRQHLPEGARLLWPVLLLVGVYVAAHRVLVRDVAEDPSGYGFADPLRVLNQAAFGAKHLLLSWYLEPWLLPHLPGAQEALHGLIANHAVLALIPCLVAWRLRDRLMAFGLAWMLATALPTLLLTNFHAGRYYYLPAIGAGIVWCRLLTRAWQGASRGRLRVLKPGLCLFGLYLALSGPATVHAITSVDREESEIAEAGFRLLRAIRTQIEPGVLIVLRNAPSGYFKHGMGATEMVRMALGDPTAYGVTEKDNVPPARLAAVNRIQTVYLLDLHTRPLQLIQVPPQRR